MCVDASKRAWLALIALATVHVGLPLTAAQPARPRLVWVVPSAALSSAAQKAFEPTQIELIAGTDAVQVAQLGAAFDPRRLARDHAASAVVWTGTAELYVYDARLDALIGTRALPETPLDAATAAAIVLSVKTYLAERAAKNDNAPGATTSDISGSALTVTPSVVPIAIKGGEPEREITPATREEPSVLERAEAAQEPHSAPMQPGPVDERDRVAEPVSVAHRAPLRLQWNVAANGGMRLAMHKLGPELRYGLSLQLSERAAAWGVILDLSAGTGFRTQRTQLQEPAAALLGAWNALDANRWRITCVAGPALHWLLIDIESAQKAQRLRPHLYAGLRISWHAPAGWFIGATANADIPLTSQRYWVNEQLTLEARAVGISAQLNAGASLGL